MKESVRQTIKEMVRQIRHPKPAAASGQQTYNKLLQLRVSYSRFEQIVHDIQMQGKNRRANCLRR